MQLFHCAPFCRKPQPSIATIGNFDGLHLGHQALLKQLTCYAQQKKLKSTVIIFEPQPLEFLKPNDPPARLYRLTDKLIMLKQMGIDQVIVLRFNEQFSCLSADDFIQQLLINQLAIKELLVGADFRFGRDRTGTTTLLKNYEKKGVLNVFLLPSITQNQVQISSTEIRRQLALGHFPQAEKLLGRPFGLFGRVIHGAKIGRLLQFPTINIALQRKKIPLQGVYAVRVKIKSQSHLKGIANIGFRPTITETKQPLLEIFLFTEEKIDLYTQRVYVEFLIKVRDEKRFDSLAALTMQIKKDVAAVQQYFVKQIF